MSQEQLSVAKQGRHYQLSVYDPDGYNTAIIWRQPDIDWIIAQETSPENPIDTAFNNLTLI